MTDTNRRTLPEGATPSRIFTFISLQSCHWFCKKTWEKQHTCKCQNDSGPEDEQFVSFDMGELYSRCCLHSELIVLHRYRDRDCLICLVNQAREYILIKRGTAPSSLASATHQARLGRECARESEFVGSAPHPSWVPGQPHPSCHNVTPHFRILHAGLINASNCPVSQAHNELLALT